MPQSLSHQVYTSRIRNWLDRNSQNEDTALEYQELSGSATRLESTAEVTVGHLS